MTTELFNNIIEKQISLCNDILCSKAEEYATEDRLHNFKNAAGMMGCSTTEALSGMMAKHTISIYDMCRDGKKHDLSLWDEKITDHINYLLLLKALVVEEAKATIDNAPMGTFKCDNASMETFKVTPDWLESDNPNNRLMGGSINK